VFTSPRRSSAPRGGDKIRHWFIVCQEPSSWRLDVTLPTLPTSLLPGAKTTPKTTPILLRLKRAIASCTTVSSSSLASTTRCHCGWRAPWRACTSSTKTLWLTMEGGFVPSRLRGDLTAFCALLPTAEGSARRSLTCALPSSLRLDVVLSFCQPMH
jgi:hypothetical protein